jgi:hypothetical protein
MTNHPSFPEALRTGYVEAWKLLRWLLMPLAAYLAILGWIMVAALVYGFAAAFAGPVAGAVCGLGTAALLPATWGAYYARNDPND